MPQLLVPEVLSVEEVILHIVDPPAKKATANRREAGEARGLKLSQRALPRSAKGPSVHDYFKQHIERALAHSDLRAAVFRPDDGAEAEKRAEVRRTLAALRDDPGRLVDDSARLARRLNELVASRDVISAGDLAVCVCRGGSGEGDWSRFVALLKIDSTLGFQQVIEEEGGETLVTLELTDEAIEVLPTSRQPVQKAAFVRPRGKSRHDLLLLDRQTSGVSGKVAQFFADDFLGAEVQALGTVPETDSVYRAVLDGLNQVQPENAAEEAARLELEKGIAGLWTRERVGIEEVGALFPDEVRGSVVAALRATLPAEEVELDLDFARRLSQRRRFEGAGGLVVTAPASEWRRLLHRQRFVPRGAGKKGYWEIVLHTEDWKEVR